MLRRFWQILPVCLYKRLARQQCEIVIINGIRFVQPARDVLIRV